MTYHTQSASDTKVRVCQLTSPTEYYTTNEFCYTATYRSWSLLNFRHTKEWPHTQATYLPVQHLSPYQKRESIAEQYTSFPCRSRGKNHLQEIELLLWLQVFHNTVSKEHLTVWDVWVRVKRKFDLFNTIEMNFFSVHMCMQSYNRIILDSINYLSTLDI